MASNDDETVERALRLLRDSGAAPGEVTRHDAVMTAEAHAEACGSLDGVLCKNLFLKGGKGKKKKMYLATVRGDRQIDIKAFAQALGATGGVRFADEKTMLATLGVARGSVTPVALANDEGKGVVFVLDQALVDSGKPVLLHPLTNTATVGVPADQLLRFAEAHAASVEVLDFGKFKAAAAAAAPAGAAAGPGGKKQKQKKPDQKKKKQQQSSRKKKGAAEEAGSSEIPSKEGDFAKWYSQLVVRAELIEYYDVSGCYILRPQAYAMWEFIQSFFDGEIKKLGVRNAYFPLFVTESALTAEKDHVEGFSPEVAWVTRAGETELDQPLALRPTSETVFYPFVSKWVRSYRDLPLRLNQWSNVVRWEFKFPTPFIRSREFLWQEGHSAFATRAEADEEVLQILDLYAQVYEDLLAVPVTKGRKTEMEKFAGGLYTTTVEAFVPTNGRGIQGATSHCLGQNFAKMFNITFLDDRAGAGAGADGDKKKMVWQNSWGLTTRTIGVMIMQHGDDRGLVLPPRVAPTQVVVIPLFYKDAAQNARVLARCAELRDALAAAGVRTELDDSTNHNPGWKFVEWEIRGVPVQIRVGPKDVEARTVEVVRRDTQERQRGVRQDGAVAHVRGLLSTVQREMLERARAAVAAKTAQVATWAEFMDRLQDNCRVLAPWCGVRQCEDNIKTQSAKDSKVMAAAAGEAAAEEDDADADRKLTGAAKSLCIPFEQPELKPGLGCVFCEEAAVNYTLFGRSY